MGNNIQVLDNKIHAKIKIKNGLNIELIKTQYLLPVVVPEFSRIATEWPIVFVKNPETGQFQPVAMLGLEPEENLAIINDKWLGTYIPHVLTRYPLTLSQHPEDESKLLLGIVESSDLVGEDEGHALFDENGQETNYFKRRKDSLLGYVEFSQMTEEFIKLLTEKNLLIPRDITLEANGEKHNINGIYIIDDNKLADLADNDFLAIRKRGFLEPIYALLTSLHQVNRLARIKNKLA